MKYRLSTLFLLCVIVALATGWYVDQPPNLRLMLVGKWRHPFPGVGYWENLNFDRDGRFRRIVHYRMGKDVFEGKYEILAENRIEFIFEQRWDESSQEMIPLTQDEKEKADCWVDCAFDCFGNLLLVNLYPNATGNVSFECGIPSRNYERGEFTFEKAVPNIERASAKQTEHAPDSLDHHDAEIEFDRDPFGELFGT